MNQTKWTEEMVGLMSSSIDTTINTWSTLQDHGEKIFAALWEQGMTAQQEGRKMFDEWMSIAKKGRESYKGCIKNKEEK